MEKQSCEEGGDDKGLACSSQGGDPGDDSGGMSPTWLKVRLAERMEGDSWPGGGQLSEDLMLKAKALAPSPSPGPDSMSVENQLILQSLGFFTCEMGLGAVS